MVLLPGLVVMLLPLLPHLATGGEFEGALLAGIGIEGGMPRARKVRGRAKEREGAREGRGNSRATGASPRSQKVSVVTLEVMQHQDSISGRGVGAGLRVLVSTS